MNSMKQTLRILLATMPAWFPGSFRSVARIIWRRIVKILRQW